MKLKHLLDEAIEVLENDLECELYKARECCCKEVPDCIVHEIREALDAIEDALCIKKMMGWAHDAHGHPHDHDHGDFHGHDHMAHSGHEGNPHPHKNPY